MNAKLPPNLDPNDPNIGSTYRSDVVRDVTDFRTASGSREVGEDRIKSLEDRIAWLTHNIMILGSHTGAINNPSWGKVVYAKKNNF